jgi:1,4-dihydroxy-2-naphthoyl-CoA hydrolase
LILQPFGVLHGGITAFLAENLSSMGASVVSRWARVAGIDLNVNHLLSASIGETVHVDATPLRAGKRVQVSNQFSFNVLIASDF